MLLGARAGLSLHVHQSALKFALDLKPSVAVAMHGNPVQLNKFKGLVEKDMPDTTVKIPEKSEVETVAL